MANRPHLVSDQADEPGEELLPGVRQAVHRPQDLRLQRGHRAGRRADGVAALRGHDVQVRVKRYTKGFLLQFHYAL